MGNFQALWLLLPQTTTLKLTSTIVWMSLSYSLGHDLLTSLSRNVFFFLNFFNTKDLRLHFLIGLGLRCVVTRGKMVFLAQTVHFLRNGTSLMVFNWKIRLGVSTTPLHLISKELPAVLVQSWSITGKTFPSLSLSLMVKSALWLAIGILGTIQ